MVKKISLFDFAKHISIYEGPVHLVHADKFSMFRNRPVYKKIDTVAKRKGNFVKSEEKEGSYESMDYGMILYTREEAYKACDDKVKENMSKIRTALLNTSNPKEAHRLLDEVSKESSFLYYDSNELSYSHTIPYKEYKELVKIKKGKK